MKTKKFVALRFVCVIALTLLIVKWQDGKAQSKTNVVEAVLQSDLSALSTALKEGEDVNQETEKGFTPLMFASGIGDYLILDVLLKHKADVNKQNANGSTALMMAAQAGHPHYVTELLNHGADPGLKTKEGHTAAYFAKAYEHPYIYSQLLKAEKAKVQKKESLVKAEQPMNDTQLPRALENIEGQAEIERADAKVETGQPNREHISSEKSSVKAEPGKDLFQAVLDSDIDALSAAISRGEDVNQQTKMGVTPLMAASRIGDFLILEVLLQNNADVNKKNFIGATALMLAAQAGYIHYVTELLSHGADPMLKTKNGRTAAYFARAYKHEDIYQQVVEAEQEEADRKKELTEINKPLSKVELAQNIDEAILDSDAVALSNALAAGGDVNKQSRIGFTPLMSAARIGDGSILEVLLKYKADVDLQNSVGATALMLAAKGGFPQYVNELLAHGADPRIKTREGYSAASFAKAYGFEKIYWQLLKAEKEYKNNVRIIES